MELAALLRNSLPLTDVLALAFLIFVLALLFEEFFTQPLELRARDGTDDRRRDRGPEAVVPRIQQQDAALTARRHPVNSRTVFLAATALQLILFAPHFPRANPEPPEPPEPPGLDQVVWAEPRPVSDLFQDFCDLATNYSGLGLSLLKYRPDGAPPADAKDYYDDEDSSEIYDTMQAQLGLFSDTETAALDLKSYLKFQDPEWLESLDLDILFRDPPDYIAWQRRCGHKRWNGKEFKRNRFWEPDDPEPDPDDGTRCVLDLGADLRNASDDLVVAVIERAFWHVRGEWLELYFNVLWSDTNAVKSLGYVARDLARLVGVANVGSLRAVQPIPVSTYLHVLLMNLAPAGGLFEPGSPSAKDLGEWQLFTALVHAGHAAFGELIRRGVELARSTKRGPAQNCDCDDRGGGWFGSVFGKQRPRREQTEEPVLAVAVAVLRYHEIAGLLQVMQGVLLEAQELAVRQAALRKTAEETLVRLGEPIWKGWPYSPRGFRRERVVVDVSTAPADPVAIIDGLEDVAAMLTARSDSRWDVFEQFKKVAERRYAEVEEWRAQRLEELRKTGKY